MTDFSWDYVTRTATEAAAALGRDLVATIAAAVEPGIYTVEPDVVYAITESTDSTGGAAERVVTRNGLVVSGPASASESQLVAIACELAAIARTVDIRDRTGQPAFS